MNSIKFDGKDIYPSKIVCIGRNYVDHIEELHNEVPKQPIIFIKPNSSISKNIYSNKNDVIHYEGEISFLISSDKLKGVGFGLDLTKREVQSNLRSKGLPWERAKSFDKSAVFSEFVTFRGNISDLNMELYINSSLVQKGGCDLMLNKPGEILNEVAGFPSFEDGDLIMTGTPKGVGPIKSGDKFNGKIFEKRKLVVEGCWVVK
ncbi:MAG: fumarylacetoacetate hydrolase family protein [Candidatus Celaenobacter antarcticus]|nr:fumarylacetoacetate hydrolase family protein [Candidatus Celaenobacter antarcticus]